MIEQIKDRLMAEAREKGICLDGYKEMRSDDKHALVDYYLAHPDWCLSRGFPDMETLVSEFGDCGDKGVYVGRRFNGETLDSRQVYVLHGCEGWIRTGLNVEAGIIPMFYIANGCRIRLTGTGDKIRGISPSIVPVYIFGKNDVAARDNRYVRFNRCKTEIS